MHYFILTIFLISSLFAKNSEFSIIIDKSSQNIFYDISQSSSNMLSSALFLKKEAQEEKKEPKTYTNAFDYLSSLSESSGMKMQLIRIDDKAKILFDKSTNLTNFDKVYTYTKTEQNEYIVIGSNTNNELLYAKLNENTEIITSKTISGTLQNKINALLSLKDGSLLIIGSSATTKSQSYDLFNQGLGLNDIYILKISKDGTLLWGKKYGTQYDDNGIDAIEASDGTIVVLGQTNHEKQHGITTLRLTPDGDQIWINHSKNEKNTTANKIVALKNGNFLLSLSVEDEMSKEQIRLIKFDIHKNILLDKVIATRYASVLKDIKEYANGQFAGVGYVKDKEDTDALAVMLDKNFNILAQEHYGDIAYDTFEKVSILKNGQIAAIGTKANKIWVVKLDKNLSIAGK
ncbi:MAG: hypothetical protein QG559_32 [Campylobacterota bacterium]|nr:hypothetical protein [Campylobacterota bacterium]